MMLRDASMLLQGDACVLAEEIQGFCRDFIWRLEQLAQSLPPTDLAAH